MSTMRVFIVSMVMWLIVVMSMTVIVAMHRAMMMPVNLMTAVFFSRIFSYISPPVLPQQISPNRNYHASRHETEPGIELFWQNVASGKQRHQS
jgi:hypothetical protein